MTESEAQAVLQDVTTATGCVTLRHRKLLLDDGRCARITATYDSTGEMTDDMDAVRTFSVEAEPFGAKGFILLPCDLFDIVERSTIH
ncbi:MAG: hypothetical protein ACK5X3_03230 [Pseudomonadota bacterium]